MSCSDRRVKRERTWIAEEDLADDESKYAVLEVGRSPMRLGDEGKLGSVGEVMPIESTTG